MQKGLIFTKPIEGINFEDIEAFCGQRIAEGQHLDYKLTLTDNEKLAQTISAFANAHGGVILIGVGDDSKENKPVVPIEGMPFDRDIEGRIMNVILSRIYPPIFSDIAVIPHSDPKKCVALIRIPESIETPHTVNERKGIFVRTGNRKTLYEEQASLEDIEWLLSRREKAERLRDQLVEAAIKRSENMFKIKCMEARTIAIEESRNLDDVGTAGNGIIEITPVFPHKPFCTSPKLCELFTSLNTNDYFRTYEFGFPPQRHEHKISQFGCYTAGMPGCYWYTEVNNYGLFLHREEYYKKRDTWEGIQLRQLVARVDQSLGVVKQFYEKIGYWGNIRFRFHLENLFDKGLEQTLLPSQWPHPGGLSTSPNERCDIERFFMFSELKDRLQWLVLEIIQEISWNFGFKINLKTAEKYLLDNGRWIDEPAVNQVNSANIK